MSTVAVRDTTSRKQPTKNRSALVGSSIYKVPLELITHTYNDDIRETWPNLAVKGHTFLGVFRMLTSRKAEDRKAAVALIEENEFEPDNDGSIPFQELSDSMRANDQIQTILVRQLGAVQDKDDSGKVVGMKYGYKIVVGNRRAAAIAYNFAKFGEQSFVEAKLFTGNDQNAFEYAVAENIHRKDLTDIEYGRIIQKYKTDFGWDMKQIAEHLHKPYGFVRGRCALASATQEASVARVKLDRGEITTTTAIQISLGEKKIDSSGEVADALRRKTVRQHVRNLKELQVKFDELPRDGTERTRGVMEGLAYAMNSTYKEEFRASDQRIKGQSKKDKIVA